MKFLLQDTGMINEVLDSSFKHSLFEINNLPLMYPLHIKMWQHWPVCLGC